MEGRPLPSVTQIINRIKWGEAIPSPEQQEKMEFGTRIHQITTELDEDPDKIKAYGLPELPYLQAYLDWKKTSGISNFRLIEKKLISRSHRFGGTIDRAIPGLVDLKTGSLTYADPLQLAGYWMILVENNYSLLPFGSFVQLKEDGTYSVQSYNLAPLCPVFLNCLSVFNYFFLKEEVKNGFLC
jgi:uncharacterized protein Usg